MTNATSSPLLEENRCIIDRLDGSITLISPIGMARVEVGNWNQPWVLIDVNKIAYQPRVIIK